MKVIITGGGTGGHVYPALSIAAALEKKYNKVDILFIGTDRGLEADVVPKAGYAFRSITVKGFRRKLSLDTFKTIAAMFKGFFQAGKLIRKFKPDIIIGTGGYVAGPVMLQGFLKGVKTTIHEQNAIPGVTVKLLSRLMNNVMISYEDSEKYFKKTKLVFTGNPLRDAFTNHDQATLRKKMNINQPCLLSVGGSGGAKCINDAALELIENFNGKDIKFIHVTGKRYYDDFMADIALRGISLEDNIEIIKYAYNYPELLVASDMVLSRAGALTLSENALVGKPSILIPSPNVAHNHQEYNARVFEKHGAAIMIREADIKAMMVTEIVKEHLLNAEHLKMMSENATKLSMPNAIKLIIDNVDQVLRG